MDLQRQTAYRITTGFFKPGCTSRISEEFRENYPSIPWSSMIGTRNIIVHGYDQVRLQIIWGIMQRDLTNLKAKITEVLDIYSR
jgi:uncharacterized protein with HEPN domain